MTSNNRLAAWRGSPNHGKCEFQDRSPLGIAVRLNLAAVTLNGIIHDDLRASKAVRDIGELFKSAATRLTAMIVPPLSGTAMLAARLSMTA
jgi:hypothetical protein